MEYSQRLEEIAVEIIVGIKKHPFNVYPHGHILDNLMPLYTKVEVEFVIDRLLICDVIVNTMLGYTISSESRSIHLRNCITNDRHVFSVVIISAMPQHLSLAKNKLNKVRQSGIYQM